MKINKLFNSVNDVMSDVFDGAVIMLGGFGEAGRKASVGRQSSHKVG